MPADNFQLVTNGLFNPQSESESWKIRLTLPEKQFSFNKIA
jgi:hypothetical protein